MSSSHFLSPTTAPDNVIYQLLEKVTVLSRERIRVTLRDGLEIEQAVEHPKGENLLF